MTDSTRRPARKLGFGFWSFLALMLGLTVLFAWLGVWQVQRLAEKEALLAEVGEQLQQPPAALPPAEEWDRLDLEDYAYSSVQLTGSYLENSTVFVFTNLPEPKGERGGPGYWVMTAFEPETGGTVFVNRGFIPQASIADFRDEPVPQGEQSITGIALPREGSGSFTPEPDIANRIEWVRDPARLAAMAGLQGPVLGLTVDAPAGEPGALPQGGETVIEFPNNHLGYAMTWFGFALLTPGLLAVWVRRQLRPVAG
ncbi:MAG TPA: SURF1 family protein [Devosia sp.]|nr:SURF1 family protein [Devosia sp.]